MHRLDYLPIVTTATTGIDLDPMDFAAMRMKMAIRVPTSKVSETRIVGNSLGLSHLIVRLLFLSSMLIFFAGNCGQPGFSIENFQ